MNLTQAIPNTDNLEVAKLAAALYLFELGKSSETLRDITAEQREEELREIYQMLSELTQTSAGGWSR